jgi:Mg-chelatase subunit ChlD
MQHDFILLDRSGSMGGSMWVEALGAINGYVQKLAEDNVDTGVTLAVFDSNNPFEVIRDRITPKTWKKVTNEDAMPRGGTPLNDAAGKLIDLAEKGTPHGGQYDKVAIIVMTDGHENASKEYTTEKIKARLDVCRSKNWQVIFLGANFDNASQATMLGATPDMFVMSSVRNMGATMQSAASKRGLYGSGASASMGYTAEEKANLAKS